MNKTLTSIYKTIKKNKTIIMIVFIIIIFLSLYVNKEYYALNTPSLIPVTVSWPAITRASYPDRELTSDEKSKLKYKVELLTVLGDTITEVIDFKEVIAITSVTFQEVSITDSETKIRVKVYARLDQDGSAYSTEGATKDSDVLSENQLGLQVTLPSINSNDVIITIGGEGIDEFPEIEGFTKHNDTKLEHSVLSPYKVGEILYSESRETMTIQQAKDKCNELANCGGFYDNGTDNVWKFVDGRNPVGGDLRKDRTGSTAYLKNFM